MSGSFLASSVAGNGFRGSRWADYAAAAFDRRARDGEPNLDVAARRPRIGADLVSARHQLDGLGAIDRRGGEVERSLQAEAALTRRPDADARGDARAGEIELPFGCETQEAGLEARRIPDGEELLRVRPGPARSSHLR